MIYFENPGKENTERVLELARTYAIENGIKTVVIASTTGYTAIKAYEIFKNDNINLIVVTHYTGFLKPNHQQFSKKIKEELEEKGVKILTCQHTFGGINKISSDSIGNIIANTLRMFSEGVKVGVEIALMASDAGLVKSGEEIITISGTAKGADTALLLKTANSTRIFDLRIKKVLAKPL